MHKPKKTEIAASPRLHRAITSVVTIAGTEMAKSAEDERKRREAIAAELDKAIAAMPQDAARDLLKTLLTVAGSANGKRIASHPMVDAELLAEVEAARAPRNTAANKNTAKNKKSGDET